MPNDAPSIIWRHQCPFVGEEIDEHDRRFIECRCFEGAAFLAAQDSLAVAIDAQRTTKDQ